jgi:hypothetical protein
MEAEEKLQLLLLCLRVTCRFFKGDEEECDLADKYHYENTDPNDESDYETHIACNCDGNISRCDLPEKFHVMLY